MSDLKEKIVESIKKVYDPEIPVNIYELGLIYDIKIDKGDVEVIMTLEDSDVELSYKAP